MKLTSASLGEIPALIDVSIKEFQDDSPTTWIRGGDGFIGFGIYKSHIVRGANRFDQARQWWREQVKALDVHNHVGGSETGPILFASFAFDEAEESFLIIPEVVVGHRNGNSWITWIGSTTQPTIQRAAYISQPLNISWVGENRYDWQNQVAIVIEKIASDKLKKVVIAQSIHGQSRVKINQRKLLSRLASEYPSTWIYSNNGLIGATPELLVRLSESIITSRILAGTILKSGDHKRDLKLVNMLASSSKDLKEHGFAVFSVTEALSQFSSSIDVPDSPYVLELPNVMHLASDVTAFLAESTSQIDIFDVVSQLHPSAAVCGTPKDLAKRTIDEIETITRGRYAGPVGWIDSNGNGELGIALRCGQISNEGKSIRLYAGCGIVAGSDPDREYAESQAKLLPILNALRED